MVEQLGLAMILSSGVSSLALISGTTSFLVGSMRQAEELSITTVPTSAKRGACSLRDAAAGRENGHGGAGRNGVVHAHHLVFLAPELNFLTHRFLGGHGQQFRDREITLGQHFQHFGAHQAGGTYDGNFHDYIN